jgi:hypothetical protein
MPKLRDGDIVKSYFLDKERYGIVITTSDIQVIIFPKYKVGCNIENYVEVLGNAIDSPELLDMVM